MPEDKNDKATLFQKHDLSSKRNVFVAGGIHGRFDLLTTKLDEFGYDKSQDQLILCGDLVDRGPFSNQGNQLVQSGKTGNSPGAREP